METPQEDQVIVTKESDGTVVIFVPTTKVVYTETVGGGKKLKIR